MSGRQQHEDTTELATIRRYPSRFMWGKLLKIHDVGDYTIVEAKYAEEMTPTFHPYVEGRIINRTAPSLEGAILLAFGFARVGPVLGDTYAMAAAKLFNIRMASDEADKGLAPKTTKD